jgi:hypothetical protein
MSEKKDNELSDYQLHSSRLIHAIGKEVNSNILSIDLLKNFAPYKLLQWIFTLLPPVKPSELCIQPKMNYTN